MRIIIVHCISMSYYTVGNGLQYVKITPEEVRLSKGMEAGISLFIYIISHSLTISVEIGMEVTFAYGWIDLLSYNKLPIEVIIGISRDPIMAIGLRVQNIKASSDFYINELGMKVLPFPLVRTATL